MDRRLTIASFLILIAATAASCGRPPARTDKRVEPSGTTQVTADAATGADDTGCSKLLDAMRSLRDGPQPCTVKDDCTVWHNGEYWDGCPPEVNVTNATELDGMRKEIGAAGCPVETNANCAPRIVRGCVAQECGGTQPFTLHLTDEQKAALEVKTAPRTGQVGALEGGP